VNGVVAQGKMYRIVEQDVKQNGLTLELVDTSVNIALANPAKERRYSNDHEMGISRDAT